MKTLLHFSIGLLLLSLHSSCAESIAEDGTKRGTLTFAGSILKNGKEYYVFAYNRMESIGSADESTGYFYYWYTYTLDAKTGKVVHQTEYEIGDYSGDFMGTCDDYAFFAANNELYAIDLHRDNGIIQPAALKKLIGSKNPSLKGQIATMEIDSYRNFRVTTTTGDLYLLDFTNLKAERITDELPFATDYQLRYINPYLGEISTIGNMNTGLLLSDTSTLFLQSNDPANTHKRFFYRGTYPDTKSYVDKVRGLKFEKLDSAFFLDGYLSGQKDAIAYLTFLTSLGNQGKEFFGAYDLNKHRFAWKKPVQSLYDPVENSNTYNLSWNHDGSTFVIGAVSNEYTPYSLVDAKTGKVRWKF